MRTRLTVFLAAAVAAVCCASPKQQSHDPQVRKPAVAGAFYPADPKELARVVDEAIARAQTPQIAGTLTALVSPHAGYEFSAPVAAYGYSLLKGRKFARVVVIAPTHVDGFNFTSVYDGDAYETPLGIIPVDKEFAARLAGTKAARLSSRGHTPAGDRGEHAIEVQLPFLQRTLGEFKLVPIVMGGQDYDSCRSLGAALARLIAGGPETLIVASSDLSHYHPYKDAVRIDGKTLGGIREWDYLSLSRNLESQVWEACGGGPIIAAMIASERLGARQAQLLKYANSGDTSGDKTRVVGYGSMAFLKVEATKGGAAAPLFTLRDQEKKELLALARKSVETAVRERKFYELPEITLAALSNERGAFVTLKEKGELRGCIGYVAASKPLAETVRDVAAMAAVKDTRFMPVAPAELDSLEYEISVLSPLRRIHDIKEIAVGRDGLIIRKGGAEGLLLPQVPTEQHWDLPTFLEQTSIKAGLPPDAWKDPQADIFAFTALVFGDRPARPVSH
jgi:MEMO1 family protein